MDAAWPVAAVGSMLIAFGLLLVARTDRAAHAIATMDRELLQALGGAVRIALGMLLLYGRIEGPPTGNIHDAIHKKPWRSAAFRYFTMHTLDDWPELRAKCTHDLLRLMSEGRLKVPIYDRIPLAEAPRAHRVFESGQVMGKLLMKP